MQGALQQMQAIQREVEAGRAELATASARRTLFGPGAGVPASGGVLLSGIGVGAGAPRAGVAAAETGAAAAGAGAAAPRAGAAAPTSSMPPLDVKRPYFRGEMDSDVLDKWIVARRGDIEYHQAAGMLLLPFQQVVWLSQHLEDAAADWWRSVAKPLGLVVDADGFMAALNTRFRSRLDADVAQEQLGQLKQGRTQPVSEYISKVQSLLTRLPAMDAHSRVWSFTRGLLPHLAQKVREQQPATVEVAYETAVRMEGSFLGTTAEHTERSRPKPGGGKGTAAAVNAVAAAADDDGDAAEALEAAVLAAMRRIGAPGGAGAGADGGAWQRQRGQGAAARAGGGTTLRCYRCGKEGHYMAECTAKERVCYGCGKGGHIRADCPEGQTKQGTESKPAQQGK